MISSPLPVIPADALPFLTPYERATARYLAEKGRLLIEDPEKERRKQA